MLQNRKIIVGVTGSIAAFKSAYLVRELIRRGAETRVSMTNSATRFIAPLTFESLTHHSVALDLFESNDDASGTWHIEWGAWADAMIIAPASASTISKLAHGTSDNALTVIATALRGQLFIAPAMDLDMYRYPALRENIAQLRKYGARIIPPTRGELASGLVGEGRLSEPDDIADAVEKYLARDRSLAGKHVLITSGPTREAIDSVRFISNYSSGKMGRALAEEAVWRGAEVTFVTGPVAEEPDYTTRTIRVESVEEMASAVEAYRHDADVVIAAAAVSDFAPAETFDRKMKRRSMSDNELVLKLAPTTDILKTVGLDRRDDQVIVGFALEDDDLVDRARKKLVEKKCDLIVANSVGEGERAFGSDDNSITLVTSDFERSMPSKPKRECAVDVFDAIEEFFSRDRSGRSETPNKTASERE